MLQMGAVWGTIHVAASSPALSSQLATSGQEVMLEHINTTVNCVQTETFSNGSELTQVPCRTLQPQLHCVRSYFHGSRHGLHGYCNKL